MSVCLDKFRFIPEKERISALGKTPASGRPLLLGINQGVAVHRLAHLGGLVRR
jgi:hypothetical protein